jgi:hypothetical protein
MAHARELRDQSIPRFQQELTGTMFGAAVIGLIQIALFNTSIRAAAVPMLGAMILGPVLLSLVRAFVPR